MYYDRFGRKITFQKFAELASKPEEKIVARSFVWWDTITVSTVWLGIDHGFNLGSRPIIFETMVLCRFLFFGSFACTSFGEARYSNQADAISGHQKIVEEVSSIRWLIQHLLKEHDWH